MHKVKINQYIFLLIALILVYLILGTGLHGDDPAVISTMQQYSLKEFFSKPVDLSIFGITGYYLYWWPYSVFGYEYQFAYDVIKVIAHIVSIYFVYKFSRYYLPDDRAFIASVIFVLYPLHDATTYWYMTFSYVLIPAILLYSHHLIRENKSIKGFLVLIMGTFASYGTPPYIFGLATIFFFEKKFKKAIIFIVPGLLYVAYYFWIKFNYVGVERRINPDLSALDFLKQVLMQFLSFVESILGPSYWLKVFYAIESIGIISVIIVSLMSFFAFINVEKISKAPAVHKALLVGLASVLILSFGMYALTGLYSHSAFNLGNRSTVYMSLLIAFLLALLLPANKKSLIFLLIIFLVPVFGLSDHWKDWNENQKNVIENIKNNQDLKEIESDATLVVVGNIYSKLGSFSHIEFFSMPWNVNAIFRDSAKTKNIVALAPYVVAGSDYILDPKFGAKYSLKKNIYVYDSEKNLVKLISAKEVPDLIKQQPEIVRHWVQLFEDTWVQGVIVWLSPRLVYLFK